MCYRYDMHQKPFFLNFHLFISIFSALKHFCFAHYSSYFLWAQFFLSTLFSHTKRITFLFHWKIIKNKRKLCVLWFKLHRSGDSNIKVNEIISKWKKLPCEMWDAKNRVRMIFVFGSFFVYFLSIMLFKTRNK